MLHLNSFSVCLIVWCIFVIFWLGFKKKPQPYPNRLHLNNTSTTHLHSFSTFSIFDNSTTNENYFLLFKHTFLLNLGPRSSNHKFSSPHSQDSTLPRSTSALLLPNLPNQSWIVPKQITRWVGPPSTHPDSRNVRMRSKTLKSRFLERVVSSAKNEFRGNQDTQLDFRTR